VIKESLKLSLAASIVLVGFIVAMAPILVSRFNSDPGVRYYGTQMIYFSFYGPIFIVFSHIYNAACRAAGNVRIPMYIAIFSQVICKYAFVHIGLKIIYDVHILYMGTAIGYSMAGLLASLYFLRSRWTLEHGLR